MNEKGSNPANIRFSFGFQGGGASYIYEFQTFYISHLSSGSAREKG